MIMNFAILCLLILLKELLKDNKKRLIGYPVRRLSFQSYFLGFIWDIPQTTKKIEIVSFLKELRAGKVIE